MRADFEIDVYRRVGSFEALASSRYGTLGALILVQLFELRAVRTTVFSAGTGMAAGNEERWVVLCFPQHAHCGCLILRCKQHCNVNLRTRTLVASQ